MGTPQHAQKRLAQSPAKDLAKGPPQHLALFMSDLGGGGVQKVILTLAGALTQRGHQVDLVLCQVAGPLRDQVPVGVRVVGLKALPRFLHILARLFPFAAAPRSFAALLRPVLLPVKVSQTLPYLPDLVRYLRRERPAALLAVKTHQNLEAVWARQLAGVPTRVVISERDTLSQKILHKKRSWRWRDLPALIKRVYLCADAIVAVSNGVADDLSLHTGTLRQRITTIYNPVVTPELLRQAQAQLEHPWFTQDSPPVVLGVGRFAVQKDFPTLLRAFARVRAKREVRLVILGGEDDALKDAQRRAELNTLATSLGIAADVALPGFVTNPFVYMAHAQVFVLSSAWEGLPGVLIQALACGCPVVSTDCPHGPAEILAGRGCGPLVPIGDDAALAAAIDSVLDVPPDPERLRLRAAEFSVERAVDSYLDLLLGEG